MKLNEYFISSLDLSNHPIKDSKAKIKRKYYYTLKLLLEQINSDEYILQRVKQYEKFLIKEEEDNTLNFDSLMNSMIKCRLRPWNKKYKYYIFCDLALILLNKNYIENALQIICKYTNSYHKNQLEKLYEILTKPGSDITEFSSMKNLIQQYWENEEFFKKKELRIIVTANMSAGKSTLINALVGKHIVKSAQEACTRNTCYIFNKAFEDNNIHLDTPKLIMDVERKDLKNYEWNKSVSVASYFRNFDENKRRICIIDTPGVNSSMNRSHGKITRKTIKEENYDILLYVLNANKLGTDEEIYYLKWIFENVKNKKILFILNKLDEFHNSEDNIQDSINGVKNDLINLGYENPIICPLSAYYALLLKKKYYDNSLTEDEEDEYKFYLKKFKNGEYDLSKYYKDKYEAKNEFDLNSIKCGIYNLEKIILEELYEKSIY